jgi:hypothetical protein
MAHGPGREFLIGVGAPMAVVLGIYYGFGHGEHSSSSLLYKDERQEQTSMGETPPAPGTYRTGVSVSSSHGFFSHNRVRLRRENARSTQRSILQVDWANWDKSGRRRRSWGSLPRHCSMLSLAQAVK